MTVSRRLSVFVVLAALLATLLPTAPAAATPPGIVVEDGVTQPVFSYDDAVRETLWVEAPMDSDFDGSNDRIRVDVIRPAETEDGLKVPTIMEASPYYNPGSNIDTHRGFAGWWDEYFVPRGYAIVQVEMNGTARSEGCPSVGGETETIGIRAAIDWLNGRAPGYHLDGTPAEAYWSSGDVGMQGVSYVGTLPNAVATQGIDGLRTVVPIAAISSWYDYTSASGIRFRSWDNRYVVFLANYVMRFSARARAMCEDWVDWLGDQSADDTGDYTPFWQDRNYRPNTNQIKTAKTSVFMVHGMDDWNVKRFQTSRMWYEVAKRQMPRKIWIHRGAHVNPTSVRNDEWRRVMHLWMDRWLYGIENGIMDEPMADIQRPDGTWETSDLWPAPGTKTVDLRLGPAQGGVPGTLSFNSAGGNPTQTFTDDWEGENAMIGDAHLAQPNRLVYLTEPLEEDVRISGTPQVSVRFSADTTSTPLSAVLVDYGEGPTTTVAGKTPFEVISESCSPEDFENLTGCAEPMEVTTTITPERMVSRGHVDAKNNVDLRWSNELTPGKIYNISWEMQPHDYIFPAGHRIGLVLMGNHRSEIQRDRLAEGKDITIHLNSSTLTLPVVGGKDALD